MQERVTMNREDLKHFWNASNRCLKCGGYKRLKFVSVDSELFYYETCVMCGWSHESVNYDFAL